jgi:hypothetical protein
MSTLAVFSQGVRLVFSFVRRVDLVEQLAQRPKRLLKLRSDLFKDVALGTIQRLVTPRAWQDDTSIMPFAHQWIEGIECIDRPSHINIRLPHRS